MIKPDERIEIIIEFSLPSFQEERIADLLHTCFQGMLERRSYFKQVPHARLLFWHENTLIGYAGLDHRIIRIGSYVARVTGIIDLCVDPNYQHRGRGSALLRFSEQLALKGQTEFMMLFADRNDLYSRNGFRPIEPAMVTWLAIDERASHSMQRRDFSRTLMIKQISRNPFPLGEIDLLGYLF